MPTARFRSEAREEERVRRVVSAMMLYNVGCRRGWFSMPKSNEQCILNNQNEAQRDTKRAKEPSKTLLGNTVEKVCQQYRKERLYHHDSGLLLEQNPSQSQKQKQSIKPFKSQSRKNMKTDPQTMPKGNQKL